MRVPLFDSNLEAAVLGAALTRPDIIPTCNLTTADFYVPRNRDIWAAMVEMALCGDDIDAMTVCDRMALQSKRADVSYIAGLLDCAAMTSTIKTHIDQLRDMTARRRLSVGITDINDSLLAGEVGPREAGGQMQDLIIDVCDSHGELTNQEILQQAWQDLKDNQTGNAHRFIETGFKAIDDHTSGLPLNLSIVAAASGQGKTTFCDNLVINVAMRGHAVGRITLEDTSVDCAYAMMNAIAKVNNKKFYREDGCTADELSRAHNAFDRLSRLKIMYDEESTTIDEIVSKAMEWYAREKISLLIVDHASEVAQTNNGDKKINYHMRELAHRLRNICKGRFATVLVSQFNQRGQIKLLEGAVPQKDFLMDSSDLEKAARCIILLWRPEEYAHQRGENPMGSDVNHMYCKIAKVTRGGNTGVWPLTWRGEYNLVKDCEPGCESCSIRGKDGTVADSF